MSICWSKSSSSAGSHSLTFSRISLFQIYPLFCIINCSTLVNHFPSVYRYSVMQLFSCSVMSDPLQVHGLQHAWYPCPSLSLRACSNSCPLNWWGHLIISSSVVSFSCLQSFPASGSFPMSLLFASDGQSIGASALATVLPMNIQGWFPLGLNGLISLLSKGNSRIFSSTTVRKHQFFGTQPSLSNS